MLSGFELYPRWVPLKVYLRVVSSLRFKRRVSVLPLIWKRVPVLIQKNEINIFIREVLKACFFGTPVLPILQGSPLSKTYSLITAS